MTSPSSQPHGKAVDSVLLFNRFLDNADAQASAELVSSYAPVYMRLQEDTSALLKLAETRNLKPWEVLRLQRMRDLENQFSDGVAQWADNAGAYLTNGQREAVGLGRSMVKTSSMAGLPTGISEKNLANIGVVWNKLPDKAFGNLVGVSRAGEPLGSLLQAAGKESAQELRGALGSGLALGKNSRLIGRELRDIAGMPLSRGMTIARTEYHRAFREAARMEFSANQRIGDGDDAMGVVKGYRRHAAKNDRTCMACISADGELYELNDFMPTHPNCRCSIVPETITFRDLGLDIDMPEDETPPVYGPEWFRNQSKETQMKMIHNKGLYNLYEEGKIDISDFHHTSFNPEWGSNISVPSYSQMSEKVALRNVGESVLGAPEGAWVKPKSWSSVSGGIPGDLYDDNDVAIFNMAVANSQSEADMIRAMQQSFEMRVHYSDRMLNPLGTSESDIAKLSALVDEAWDSGYVHPSHSTSPIALQAILNKRRIIPKSSATRGETIGGWAGTIDDLYLQEQAAYSNGVCISNQINRQGITAAGDVSIRLKDKVYDRTVWWGHDIGGSNFKWDKPETAFVGKDASKLIMKQKLLDRHDKKIAMFDSIASQTDDAWDTSIETILSKRRLYQEGRVIGGIGLDDIDEVILPRYRHPRGIYDTGDVGEYKKIGTIVDGDAFLDIDGVAQLDRPLTEEVLEAMRQRKNSETLIDWDTGEIYERLSAQSRIKFTTNNRFIEDLAKQLDDEGIRVSYFDVEMPNNFDKTWRDASWIDGSNNHWLPPGALTEDPRAAKAVAKYLTAEEYDAMIVPITDVDPRSIRAVIAKQEAARRRAIMTKQPAPKTIDVEVMDFNQLQGMSEQDVFKNIPDTAPFELRERTFLEDLLGEHEEALHEQFTIGEMHLRSAIEQYEADFPGGVIPDLPTALLDDIPSFVAAKTEDWRDSAPSKLTDMLNIDPDTGEQSMIELRLFLAEDGVWRE